jgi:16S rRNA processing protein RimM
LASDALIALGEIVTTHATRGELRVRLYNPGSTTVIAGRRVVLRRGDQTQERRVVTCRPHKHQLLLTLESCESMSEAEALVGCELCVRESDLPAPAPHEIYCYQLIGMTVVTAAGDELGVVSEVIQTGSNDVCVVRTDTREHLIPMIDNVIRAIDRERRRLVIDPLPGLLD